MFEPNEVMKLPKGMQPGQVRPWVAHLRAQNASTLTICALIE